MWLSVCPACTRAVPLLTSGWTLVSHVANLIMYLRSFFPHLLTAPVSMRKREEKKKKRKKRKREEKREEKKGKREEKERGKKRERERKGRKRKEKYENSKVIFSYLLWYF
jgi:hypothetical protein